MSFQNVSLVEEVRGFGYNDLLEYYMVYPNKPQMIQSLKITFSCHFDLRDFPFEKHECDFLLYDRIHTEDSLIIKGLIRLTRSKEQNIGKRWISDRNWNQNKQAYSLVIFIL